jgi:nicotinamidase-related amidase
MAPEPARQTFIANVADFLEKARSAETPVIFTGMYAQRDAPVDPILQRRRLEPLFYPDGFDKFTGGELQGLLEERRVQNLVVTGASTNICVMYTATTAARIYHYDTYIPLDGVYSEIAYHHEYALHQLSVLPTSATPLRFTTLSMIEFC